MREIPIVFLSSFILCKMHSFELRAIVILLAFLLLAQSVPVLDNARLAARTVDFPSDSKQVISKKAEVVYTKYQKKYNHEAVAHLLDEGESLSR